MVAQRKEMSLVPPQPISVWEKEDSIQEIKSLFAAELTVMEFKLFIALGKATGLNPYLREIWAVKYKNNAAQIFIGRDGYRKGAQRQPSYDYHLADAVYDGDEFSVDNGEVKHKYSLKNRGNLIGAYCVVKRKGSSRASFVFVNLDEYDRKQSTWNDKKATMIKKVAEAQGLRSCFQDVFGGTYHEYEQFKDVVAIEPPKASGKGLAALEQSLGIEAEPEVMEAEVIEAEPSPLEKLKLLMEDKKVATVVERFLTKAKVGTIEELQADQIEKALNHLTKKDS